MHSPNKIQPGLVRFIAEGAAQDSARSLDLLRDIELTVEVNETLFEQFETIAERVKHATEAICAKPIPNDGEMIDKDDNVHDTLGHTLDVLQRLHDLMVSKRQAANADHALRPDDGVVESFDQIIAGISHAHDAINELLWAILEHDADCSPLSGKGPFTSVDDLLAAIKS